MQQSSLTIKSIMIKRTAPLVIKNIFNAEHNRKPVEQALRKQAYSLIKENYKLNTQTLNYDQNLKSWLKLFMLHHLKFHVFARLTKGDHGVAIKAIRDIPKGTPVFENMGGHCALYYPIDVTEREFDDHVNQSTKIIENVTINLNEKKTVERNPIKELLNDFFLQLCQHNKLKTR